MSKQNENIDITLLNHSLIENSLPNNEIFDRTFLTYTEDEEDINGLIIQMDKPINEKSMELNPLLRLFLSTLSIEQPLITFLSKLNSVIFELNDKPSLELEYDNISFKLENEEEIEDNHFLFIDSHVQFALSEKLDTDTEHNRYYVISLSDLVYAVTKKDYLSEALQDQDENPSEINPIFNCYVNDVLWSVAYSLATILNIELFLQNYHKENDEDFFIKNDDDLNTLPEKELSFASSKYGTFIQEKFANTTKEELEDIYLVQIDTIEEYFKTVMANFLISSFDESQVYYEMDSELYNYCSNLIIDYLKNLNIEVEEITKP